MLKTAFFKFKNTKKCKKRTFKSIITFNKNVMSEVVWRQAAGLDCRILGVFHNVLHSPRTVTHLLSHALQALR